jgi:DNA-binding HxlR family transcriptional regulator
LTLAVVAEAGLKYFRQKGIIVCNAGSRRHIRMSEQEMVDADKVWAILGKRWTLPILHRLAAANVLRFTELKRSLEGISGTMLSERLLDLEREGLIRKEVYVSVPPKVEYSLTDSGRELVLIIGQVVSWHTRRSKNDAFEIPSMSSH